jgi:hypothetical protein
MQAPDAQTNARDLAASKNFCTDIVLCADIEDYVNTSEEFKSAARALKSVVNQGCKCGNESPKKFYAACGEHLSCEMCYQNYYLCGNKRGECTFPGCNQKITWPPVHVKAYDTKQSQAITAIHAFHFALQKEEQKDTAGQYLRDVAMGREDLSMRVKRRKRADYSEEEWQEKTQKKEAAAERKRLRLETLRKAENHDKVVIENQRLRNLLIRNNINFEEEETCVSCDE